MEQEQGNRRGMETGLKKSSSKGEATTCMTGYTVQVVACFLVITVCIVEADQIWRKNPFLKLSDLLTSKGSGVVQVKSSEGNRSLCPERPPEQKPEPDPDAEKVRKLLEIWSQSSYLKEGAEIFDEELARVPRPPHLENCKQRSKDFSKMDNRSPTGERPNWTLWKNLLGLELGKDVPTEDRSEELLLNKTGLIQGPFPPWVHGGDEDNLPMTRRVQRDLWLHQHPKNCRDQSLKFLFVEFANHSGWGVGAQLNAISGFVAVAMNENRVLVLDYFNRAEHDGCKDGTKSRWTCYFVPETTNECRDRALELLASEEAKKNRTITTVYSYWGGMTWFTPYPDHWGAPWEIEQPTSQVNGVLTVRHNQMKIWWWRAQAIRYLTRHPSEYLCHLLNKERHRSFGAQAAALVVKTLPSNWPTEPAPSRNITQMEKLVWSNLMYRPWMPRPMVSVHVRQGDKGSEMKIFQFSSYMKLANNLRGRFPDAMNIWLSTEMQNVVEESKEYTNWNFYYTNISRQTGSKSMKDYEAGLGRLASSTNSFVNLMMAVDCDLFVGALGSSWGSVIDGIRSTSGKAFAGTVSVNPGQFW